MASASIHKMTGKRGNTYKVVWRNPDGRSKSKTFKRKADASAWRNQIAADLDAGKVVDPSGGRILFADFAAEVMEARKLSLRASTIARDESYMRSLILPTFGRKRLNQITPQLIQNWITATAADRAPATVAKAYQLVGSVLRSAVDHDLLTRSPLRGIKLPKKRPAEQHYLDTDEVDRLADAIDRRYRALVLIGAYTGLRIGEMLGLRLGSDSLDLMRGKITVAHQLSEVRGELSFTEPKTRAGRRAVKLPQFLADELASHCKQYGLTPGDLVFQGAEGGPVRRTNFRRRYWAPAVAAVGHDCSGKHCTSTGPVRTHDLRHTHVGFLIAQNEHPSRIAARLGHGSVSVVLDRYGHLLPGTDEALADRLDAMHSNGTAS